MRQAKSNIGQSDRILPSVCYSGQDVIFKGICRDDDGVYFVRFDIDWLEMVPVQEFAAKKNAGYFKF